MELKLFFCVRPATVYIAGIEKRPEQACSAFGLSTLNDHFANSMVGKWE